MKFPVPDPLQDVHTDAASFWPVPLHWLHLANRLPLQMLHLNDPEAPLPLQCEHLKLLVPEPLQAVHTAASVVETQNRTASPIAKPKRITPDFM